jgi:hypothetical protein
MSLLAWSISTFASCSVSWEEISFFRARPSHVIEMDYAFKIAGPATFSLAVYSIAGPSVHQPSFLIPHWVAMLNPFGNFMGSLSRSAAAAAMALMCSRIWDLSRCHEDNRQSHQIMSPGHGHLVFLLGWWFFFGRPCCMFQSPLPMQHACYDRSILWILWPFSQCSYAFARACSLENRIGHVSKAWCCSHCSFLLSTVGSLSRMPIIHLFSVLCSSSLNVI